MKSKCRVFFCLFLVWAWTLSNGKDIAPKISTVFQNGRWSESKFNGYKFILNRDPRLANFDTSRSGLFREYYDSSKWERQFGIEVAASLIFKHKKNKLVTTFIGVREGVLPEEAQRSIFELGFKKGGFNIKSKSYGADLVNDRPFKTVFYILEKGKGDIVSYNMYFAGQNKSIFVVQTCPAVDHFKVYMELMELVSGLEIGSQI